MTTSVITICHYSIIFILCKLFSLYIVNLLQHNLFKLTLGVIFCLELDWGPKLIAHDI